jgi:hypothetical protein
MDIKARPLLIKIISIALIACIPMASADAVTKPKAAGRTAASIPNTILSGVGAPSNAIGIDGDFYIDVKNSNIYGPKMKKKWPKPVSLKGSGMALMEKAALMEKQLQMHQQLPDQVVFKVFKERQVHRVLQVKSVLKVNKVCAVKLAQLVNKELLDQLERKDQLV